jgi:hypothetical protein
MSKNVIEDHIALEAIGSSPAEQVDLSGVVTVQAALYVGPPANDLHC